MRRKGRVFIIAVSFFLIFTAKADCGWQEELEGLKQQAFLIPVPSFSEEIKKEKLRAMGNDFLITVYETGLSFAEVAAFYRERLPGLGWQEAGADKGIGQYQAANLSSELLVFKKEDNLLNVQYLPSSGEPGRTKFYLTRGKLALTEDTQEKERKGIEDYAQSKEIPVYPNAHLNPLSFVQNSLGEQWGYTTADSAEAVAEFYRGQMSAQGWEPTKEIPMAKETYSAQDIENCPACKKLQSALPVAWQNQLSNSSFKMNILRFQRGKETCSIAISELTVGEKGETLISVYYKD